MVSPSSRDGRAHESSTFVSLADKDGELHILNLAHVVRISYYTPRNRTLYQRRGNGPTDSSCTSRTRRNRCTFPPLSRGTSLSSFALRSWF